MSTRKAKIERILENRKSAAEKAKQQLVKLKNIDNSLESLASYIPELQSSMSEGALIARVKEVNTELEQVRISLQQAQNNLQKFYQRCSRGSINIGITGRAGQGKSTFLQTLTGLGEGEIPTGSDGHCTGAPSFMVHKDVSETYAQLEFYNRSEFRNDVLKPYFDELGIEMPNLESFGRGGLPSEDEYKAGRDVDSVTTKLEKLKRLRKIQNAFGEFEHLLGCGDKRIEKHEIRSYVAQRDEHDHTREFNKWYAVKKAEVFCRFPQEDITAIKVGDTPGLGDFTSGAEETLVRNIGAEMDLIVFLRSPDNRGVNPNDTTHYDLINKSIPQVNIDQWSYYLLNPKNQDEADRVNSFRDSLKNSKINTRKTLVVDAKHQQRVSECMNEILDDAVNQMANLDEEIWTKCKTEGNSLIQDIRELTQKAADVMPNSQSLNSSNDLKKLSKKTYKNMSGQLSRLKQSYNSYASDDEFKKHLLEINKTALQRVEYPKEDINGDLGKTRASWFSDGWKLLRAKFLSYYDGLDIYLKPKFEKLREDIKDVLVSPDGGNLGFLYNAEEMNATEKFFVRLAGEFDKVDEQLGSTDEEETLAPFSLACHRLLQGSLTFRSFVLPDVIGCLNRFGEQLPGNSGDSKENMSLDSAPYFHSRSGLYHYASDDTIQVCKDKLLLAWEDLIADVTKTMHEEHYDRRIQDLLSALCDEFAYSWTESHGYENCQDKWGTFHEKFKDSMWNEEFQKYGLNSRIAGEWKSLIETINNDLN